MSDDFQSVVGQLTPEIYQSMKQAVETGRWPDGRQVSDEQRAICMEAVITWEARHLPEDQRTGYIQRNACSGDRDEAQPVTLREPGDNNA